MRLFKFNLSTCAAIIAGMLLFTTCIPENPEVTLSPSKIEIEANDTNEGFVTISTNASDWDYSESSASWVSFHKKNDKTKLYFKAEEHTSTSGSRMDTVTITASIKGRTATADFILEQLKKPKNTLTLDPASLSYAANETGEKTVSVTTDAASWNAENKSGATWFTVTKQTNQFVVKVSAQNSQTTARTADITVTAGNADTVLYTVTQGAKNTLSVDKSSLTFPPGESSQTATITTNAASWDVSITSGSAWLTTSKSNNTLTITAASNTTTSSRTGGIRVTAGTADPVNISITQNAETLTINPTFLEFGPTETSSKTVTITATSSTWEATKESSATWLNISQSGNTLTVNPTSNNTSSSPRSATVTIKAGYAPIRTLTVTQNGPVTSTLTVSSTTLSFLASGGNNSLVITSNISWTINRGTATWVTFAPSSGSGNYIVTVTAQANTGATRSATVTVTGGGITRNVTVTQPGPGDPSDPIITQRSNYVASATYLENNPPYNNTSWSGIVTPTNITGFINFCLINNWGGTGGPSIYIDYDYTSKKYKLDRTSKVCEDYDGLYEGYLCMGTVSASGYATPYPDVDYSFSYNPTTRVLDFSGTYNGLPTCIMIVPKSKSTGQWVTGSYFVNIFRNLRLTLTPSSSAPEIRSSENMNDANLIKATNNMPVPVLELKTR